MTSCVFVFIITILLKRMNWRHRSREKKDCLLLEPSAETARVQSDAYRERPDDNRKSKFSLSSNAYIDSSFNPSSNQSSRTSSNLSSDHSSNLSSHPHSCPSSNPFSRPSRIRSSDLCPNPSIQTKFQSIQENKTSAN